MRPTKIRYILFLTVSFLASVKIGYEILKSLNNFANIKVTPKPTIKIKKHVRHFSIQQKVDNFNKTDNRTWSMHYSTNDKFFKADGPMFIAIHGAGPKNYIISLQKGMMYDLAREHKGYMFSMDHRFYGRHWPLPTLSKENLAYLNVKQVLADLANFIRKQKSIIKGMNKSKVILIGCGNGGTLAIWFQKIYPSLVHGTWASGAALHAKLNFYEHLESSGKYISKYGSSKCYQNIAEFFQRLKLLVSEKDAIVIRSILNLCSGFDETDQMDVGMFFSIVITLIENTFKTKSKFTIGKLCQEISKEPHKFSTLWRFLINKTASYEDRRSGCNDLSYNNYLVKSLFTIDDKKNYERQWLYQKCNEYGFFKTSNSKKQPFGNTLVLNYSIQTCANVFGEKYTPDFIVNGLRETNKQFFDFAKPLHNVYITYGEYDPWQFLTIDEENNIGIIKNATHCEDFESISNNDSPEIRASKETLFKLVRKWLR